MNDKNKGKLKQVKGGIKTKVGKLTNNNKLQIEGMLDKALGKTQEITGNIKESVHDVAKKIKK